MPVKPTQGYVTKRKDWPDGVGCNVIGLLDLENRIAISTPTRFRQILPVFMRF